MINSSASQEILDRSKPPKPGEPKDVHFPQYIDTTLPNGVNLLLIENYKIPSVSIRLVFKHTGSIYDNGKFGLSSVTAEMLQKGTAKRTASQIAEEIDFLGANLSSGSDWDGTYISLSVLKKHLDKAIEILSDVVTHPAFNEDELQRVKEQRIAGIIQSKDDPNILSEKMFNRVVYENFPYENPLEGTETSIKNITTEDLKRFYEYFYRTGNLIIAFVGAVSLDEAMMILNENFHDLNTKPFEIPMFDDRVRDKKFEPNTVYIVNKPGAVQSCIKVGHLGISRNNPDFLTVSVMNTILGGYFGSRINYTLREKHGFTYGARSNFNPRYYPGDFSVDADVRTEVTDTSISLIIEELNRIVNEEVTDEELSSVKSYLTGIFPIQLETANAVATRVINLKMYDLPKDYYDTFISNVNKLTKKDIINAAKKYIHPDNLYFVLSGNANEIKVKLKRFGEVRIFDTDENEIKEKN
jgi:predicted Zn-dependent peptidase